MPSDAIVLAFDTSAAHCAAALLSGGRVLSLRVEEMGRGQAERLMPLLEEMLEDAGLGWGDLSRIGVGVGPGNFTGIRISVSAARGLALGLGIPAVGVSLFETTQRLSNRAQVAVPAPRDQVYFWDLDKMKSPAVLSSDQLDSGDFVMSTVHDWRAHVTCIAQIAAERAEPISRPAPLYVRAAAAAPSRDVPPRILDDA